ncbi:MAG: NADPH-dependent F420 reductase [Gammaproteobacteria bacterium]|nr:NADPH-dependent F420 reductase [Gammaproteobacteria bacterium]
MSTKAKIAVLGGTGNLGHALAWRWARAGYDVTIGSRTKERAQAAADDLNIRLGKEVVKAADNSTATKAAEFVVLTVPFAAHSAVLETIKPMLSGQILIDTTVPLRPPRVAVAQLPEEGSAAEITQNIVGESARVVAAFHNAAADLLEKDEDFECDILVTGEDIADRRAIKGLVEDTGCRPVNAGKLANSAASEALTSALIHINKTYKIHSGIKITGMPTDFG